MKGRWDGWRHKIGGKEGGRDGRIDRRKEGWIDGCINDSKGHMG